MQNFVTAAVVVKVLQHINKIRVSSVIYSKQIYMHQMCDTLYGKLTTKKHKIERMDAPLKVHSGDVEDDAFKPQDHKEPLGEGTVSNALSIASCLQ